VKKSIVSLLIILCFGLRLISASDTTKTEPFLGISISDDMLNYLNNLEYFNKYRDGYLYLGAHNKLRLEYQPIQQFRFSLGLFTRKAYGDKKFLSDIRPIFRAEYMLGNYSVILGELYSDNRHSLPDAIYREQRTYEPGIEEGVQILYRGTLFSTDTWGRYDALNTPSHKENLGVGSVNFLHLKPFRLAAMVHWEHFGGHQYDPPNDPMRDNVTGCGGIGFTHTYAGKIFREWGAEEYILVSATNPNRSKDHFHKGWGTMSRAWINIFGFNASALFYKGKNFQTWQGNRMYETNKPYWHIQLDHKTEFLNYFFFDWGFRLDFVDIKPQEYFDKTENQVWVEMGCHFEKKLFRQVTTRKE